MSPIEIPLEEIGVEANWKPAGQSPAMNPGAVIQFVESLMPLLENPLILQASGIQLHELFGELIRSGPLKNNAKKIQITRDEINARMGGGPGVPGGVVAAAGGVGPEGLPVAPPDQGAGDAPGTLADG